MKDQIPNAHNNIYTLPTLFAVYFSHFNNNLQEKFRIYSIHAPFNNDIPDKITVIIQRY